MIASKLNGNLHDGIIFYKVYISFCIVSMDEAYNGKQPEFIMSIHVEQKWREAVNAKDFNQKYL